MAILSNDIIDSISKLRMGGVEFLDTPDTYYEGLNDRVQEVDEDIKTLKDFAELSSDELIGGFDEIKGKKIRIKGYLEEFSLSREEADELIMSARKIVYK